MVVTRNIFYPFCGIVRTEESVLGKNINQATNRFTIRSHINSHFETNNYMVVPVLQTTPSMIFQVSKHIQRLLQGLDNNKGRRIITAIANTKGDAVKTGC